MSCSGSLKKGRFGYQWQAARALVGPIYDTSVESTIFAGSMFAISFLVQLASLVDLDKKREYSPKMLPISSPFIAD